MTKAVLQKKFVIMYEWNNDLLNNLVISRVFFIVRFFRTITIEFIIA